MIIKSILDTDLYKLTMQQAVCQLYPDALVRYRFIDRSPSGCFNTKLVKEIRNEIEQMSTLALTPEESHFLEKACPFLSPVYRDFLQGYRFDPSEVAVSDSNGQLRLFIEGPWYRTILWEVPLLAIISEIGMKVRSHETQNIASTMSADEKRILLYDDNVNYADFGTRRRYSYAVQDEIVRVHKASPNFMGTSNVHLAMKYGTKPLGTQAHEWYMFHAAKFGFHSANRLGLEKWLEVFKGDLGIALTDTFTTDVFLKSFTKLFAKAFDGVRQDSGDPLAFADKVINHYKSLGIDPKTKTLVFSDGLDVQRAIEIKKYCGDRIRTSFGIGTNFTNDLGIKPFNIVIKLDAVKEDTWIPTVKLSDVATKHTGDSVMLDLCEQTIRTFFKKE